MSDVQWIPVTYRRAEYMTRRGYAIPLERRGSWLFVEDGSDHPEPVENERDLRFTGGSVTVEWAKPL